ncbi:peptidoglycan-binding domain-containing protein [Nonlabens xiamenensis]|uniref:peptidoglycan-binding domain-containing protein n=1 Tax=Nonlabens xiamenensis TaxID=2341043 RepID=UPI000F605740|nr:peptidoglycan-binding domain-containing protein [Nonlabens xiamenensis]
MAQFISLNSIQNSNLKERSISGLNGGNSRLTWELFRRSSLLVGIATNSGYRPLQLNDVLLEVAFVRIGIALIIKNDNLNFSISDIESTLFDSDFEAVILNYQNHYNLSPTGVVNSQTLLHIDGKIPKNIFTESKKPIGELTNFSLEISGIATSNTEEYFYYFTIDGIDFDFKSNKEKLQSNFVDPRNYSAVEVNRIPLDAEGAKQLFDFGGRIGPEIEDVPVKIEVRIDKHLINGEQLNSSQEVFDQIDKISKTKLSNDLIQENYCVKDTDSVNSIIQDFYYQNNYSISNPFYPDYGTENVVDLHDYGLYPAADRNDDARLIFFTRFIYLLNIDVNENYQVVNEYGFKCNSSEKLPDVSFIESYNLKENIFNTSDSKSCLTNYGRFLKEEQIQSNFKIEYDLNSGDCTTLSPQPGKFLVMPKREVLEAAWADANFRPHEYLTKPAPFALYDFITDVQEFIDDLVIHPDYMPLSPTVKEEIRKNHEDSYNIITKLYTFATSVLMEVWPRGTGISGGGFLGVTWGIPVYTDFAVYSQTIRKFSKEDELILKTQISGYAEVGVDIGFEFQAGLFMGKGSKRKGVGIDAGGSFQAGARFSNVQKYELPVAKHETSILASLIAFLQERSTSHNNFENLLSLNNVNPVNYLVHANLAVTFVVTANLSGQIGVLTQAPNTDQKTLKWYGKVSPEAKASEKESKMSFNQFGEWVPGFAGSGGLEIGLEFEYTAEYDRTNSRYFIIDKEKREPDKVSVSMNYLGHFQANGQLKGNNLLGSILGAGINYVLPMLSIDYGLKLGLQFDYEKPLQDPTNSLWLNLDQIIRSGNFSESNISENNGYLKFNNSYWQMLIRAGSFSGDIDSLGMPGSETYLLINAYKARQLVQSFNSQGFGNYDYSNLSNLLGVFYAFEKRIKAGIGNNGRGSKLFSSTAKAIQVSKLLDFFGNTATKDFFSIFKKDSSSPILEDFKVLLDMGFVVDIGFTLPLDSIKKYLEIKFLEFYGIYYIGYFNENLHDSQRFKEKISAFKINFRKSYSASQGSDKLDSVDFFTQRNDQLLDYILDMYNPAHGDHFSPLDLSQIDFTTSIRLFVSLYEKLLLYLKKQYNEYDTESIDKSIDTSTLKVPNATGIMKDFDEEMGTEDLFKIFAYLCDFIDLNVSVEAVLGATLGGSAKAAIVKGKGRINLSGSLSACFSGDFIEKGSNLALPGEDDLKPLIDKIVELYHSAMDTTTDKKKALKPGSLRQEISVTE